MTVFLYHDVSNNSAEFSRIFNLNVRPDIFEYQIKFIKNEFNIIGPNDLLNGNIPPRAALITFDDGLRSYFKRAVPILRKHGIPSIIFLNMEAVKGGMFWSGFITYLCQKNDAFVKFLEKRLLTSHSLGPLFLHCSKEVVGTFLTESGQKLDDFADKISMFVGEFANENDLREAENNDNVFLGNHLYNHEVPFLMSDEEFLLSYHMNRDELLKYKNFLDFFSFPFGQPGTCFSQLQVKLLLENGSQKVFCSSGATNSNRLSSFLDRVPMTSNEDTPEKLWFRVCGQSLKRIMVTAGKNYL